MNLIDMAATGAVLGFTQGCSPGPHSALLIAQTTKGNFTEGLKVAVAPIFATFPILALTLSSLSFLARQQMLLGIISVIGGLYLSWLGYEGLRSKGFETDSQKEIAGNSFLMGFNATLLSPHPYLFWSTAGGALLLSAYQKGMSFALVFLACFLSLFLVAKLGLVILSSQAKVAVHGRGLIILLRLLSLVIVAFGLGLVVEGLKSFGVI